MSVALPRSVARSNGVEHVAFGPGGFGYLFGPQLWQTRDSGRTWQRVRGGKTAALTIAGDHVYRVSYDHSGCPGPCASRVQRAGIGTTDWLTVDSLGDAGGGANIAASAAVVLVTLSGDPAGGAGDAHTDYVESRDSGAHWHRFNDPCGGRGRSESDTDAVSVRGAEVAAVCAGRSPRAPSGIVVSHDDGAHFTALRAAPVPLLGVIGAGSSRLIVGTGAIVGAGDVGYVLATTADDGHSWTSAVTAHASAASSRLEPTASISCAMDDSCVYLSEPYHLYVSLDGGRTWARRHVPDPTTSAQFSACVNAPFGDKMIQPVSPETGEHAFILQASYVGARPCSLIGYPTVVFATATGRVLPFRYRNGGGPYVTHRPPGYVNLRPGDTVFVEVAKYRCDVSGGRAAARASVRLPGASAALSVRLDSVATMDYCAETPSQLVYVSPASGSESQLYYNG